MTKTVRRSQPATLVAVLAALFAAAWQAPPARAAEAPSAAEASPGIYRVVAEDENYRVLEVTWQPGQRDAWHSHPASTTYRVTSCQLRAYLPDGTERDIAVEAGSGAARSKPVANHSLENRGTGICRVVITEIKNAK